jgi:hypothetical protein
MNFVQEELIMKVLKECLSSKNKKLDLQDGR